MDLLGSVIEIDERRNLQASKRCLHDCSWIRVSNVPTPNAGGAGTISVDISGKVTTLQNIVIASWSRSAAVSHSTALLSCNSRQELPHCQSLEMYSAKCELTRVLTKRSQATAISTSDCLNSNKALIPNKDVNQALAINCIHHRFR